MDSRPALAIVVPTLGDNDALPALLDDLARQEGVLLEVVVVDGDSSGEGRNVAGVRYGAGRHAVRLASAPPGRARQMNFGASVAVAPDLLFLHADTRLDDPLLLLRARDRMEAERARLGTNRVAGHFGVRFRRSAGGASLAYHFYEAKTLLNRADSVNGDQGFWLAREWFFELGGYDESLPFLEDVRLAARAAGHGVWLLLPGRVWTSARRFETEGFLERQTLNALIRTFDALGEPSYFAAARGLYRLQPQAERIDLHPFFVEARRAVWAGSLKKCARRWGRVGAYVRSQAWQLAFWVDAAAAFRRGEEPGVSPAKWLDAFEPAFDRLTDNPLGRGIAAGIAAVWLHGALLWMRFRRRSWKCATGERAF